jgi:GTP cyclohydrolase II
LEPPRNYFTGLIVALLTVQLRLALALLEDLGGGIILYLTRGPRVGLTNNTRTYQLQHDGPNTFDATPHSALMR